MIDDMNTLTDRSAHIEDVRTMLLEALGVDDALVGTMVRVAVRTVTVHRKSGTYWRSTPWTPDNDQAFPIAKEVCIGGDDDPIFTVRTTYTTKSDQHKYRAGDVDRLRVWANESSIPLSEISGIETTMFTLLDRELSDDDMRNISLHDINW